MVYVNQIHLTQKGIGPNRKFLKSLYNCEELEGAQKWFDKLNCNKSLHRVLDKRMTLEKFLKQINQEAYIVLQIGSPGPYDIRYGAILWNRGFMKHAFIEFPYTTDNFSITEKLYENSFNSKLTDEPIPNGLLEDYQRHIQLSKNLKANTTHK